MLRFQPHYKHAIWGGRRLQEEFGRDLPEGAVGESWDLVDLDELQSVTIASESANESASGGETLRNVWQSGRLGGSAKGEFPFLLKWLDTSQRLSVQVHPDEDTCARMQQGRPKGEAWFVAAAKPQSKMFLGHYPGLDAATLRLAAEGCTVEKWLYELRPRAGEMLMVPAGTLHAIGAGFLLLEIQQPSDTTYRVHDWGRTDASGNERVLHLDEACEATRFERHGAPKSTRTHVVGPCFRMEAVRDGGVVEASGLRVIAATDIRGLSLDCSSGRHTLNYGSVVVAEPGDGDIRVVGGDCILITEPPAPAT